MPRRNRRRNPLARKTWLDRGRGPRAVNPDRQRKRRTRRQQLHQAYRRSETYRIVAARAGGRCEYVQPQSGRRCAETELLEHHHKHYLRFGGDELPEDMLVLCKTHHHYVEGRDHSHRNRQSYRRAV